MTKIEIYTTPICGFCFRAKRLLDRKGLSYTEINVMGDSAKRGEMMQRAKGRRTVPQVFIDGKHVGGSDDLHTLELTGELDAMVAA